MMDALAHASVDDDKECDGEEGDDIGAYTQAKLGGPLTWITIPKELASIVAQDGVCQASCSIVVQFVRTPFSRTVL